MRKLFQAIKRNEKVLRRILSIYKLAYRQSGCETAFEILFSNAGLREEHTRLILIQMLQYEQLRHRILLDENRRNRRIGVKQRKEYESFACLFEKYTNHLIKIINKQEQNKKLQNRRLDG